MIGASGVHPSDVGGKADPYCVLYLLGASDNDKTQRTEVKSATLDPEWGEHFVWYANDLEPFTVRIGTTVHTAAIRSKVQSVAFKARHSH